MANDGNLGNTTIEQQIGDITSEFASKDGGALSGTFFSADTEKTVYSTYAHDINRQVEEAAYPLGKPVTGQEETLAAAATFNGMEITAPNGILNDLGSLATASVNSIEIDHNGISAMPGLQTDTPAYKQEVAFTPGLTA